MVVLPSYLTIPNVQEVSIVVIYFCPHTLTIHSPLLVYIHPCVELCIIRLIELHSSPKYNFQGRINIKLVPIPPTLLPVLM
jgi:hypothetical protein